MAVDVSDDLAAIAAASNRLTAAWAGHIGRGEGRSAAAESAAAQSTVFSGAGLWPLLGLLALGAEGPCRAELAGAYGLDPARGGSAARGFINLFDQAPALRAALGLWYRDDLSILDSWLDELPPATRGRLTGDIKADTDRLDAWADEHTDGLIKKMPVVLTPETTLVLASAILVTTTWRDEFTEFTHHAQAGPWTGRGLPALTRPTRPDTVRVVDGGPGTGPVTTSVVEGKDDIDVVLFLGEPQVTADLVLIAGIASLGAHATARPAKTAAEILADDSATAQSPGPGLTVQTVKSASPAPTAALTTPRFTIEAQHDLLASPELFGLSAASNPSTARFPGMSRQGLYLSSARQNAMAEFSATGFKAAAVTAIAMARSMAMRVDKHESRRLEVVYDRPFGFAAVHRPTGLIIVAGWVADLS
jgi:serine protease inhibitor